MSFFERNRQSVSERGLDPKRLPPGQYLTDRFPVLHVGEIPVYEPGEWNLSIFGLVNEPLTIGLEDLKSLPAVTTTFDIHCVTKWSKFDTTWTGVRVRDLFAMAGAKPEATHVMEHAEFG
ncbi:MAG: molybdopterin-dependent oxidoreductase, partial [Ilumatobacteraceae bacterium]